jgi:hypothetical protein
MIGQDALYSLTGITAMFFPGAASPTTTKLLSRSSGNRD